MYSLSDAQMAAIGGVRALLVAAFSSEALYTYATAERQTITAVTGLSGWQRLDLPDTAQAAAPGKMTVGGWQYTHQIELGAPGLAVARAYVADALKTGPVVALVQDYAGQWWLLGQRLGLLLLSSTWATGSYKGDTTQSFTLARLEPQQPRRVAVSFVNLIYNSSTVFSEAPAA
jgi:hypothetical protein